MAELIVSPAARADLIAQWDFFADEVGDMALADRYIACAEATFRKLANTPGLGRRRLFDNPHVKNLRSWQVADFAKYQIFYRLLSENRGIEIVRVIHGARNL